MQENAALTGDERGHPAELGPLEWRWIDVVLPQEAGPLAYDAAAQACVDRFVLKLIKSWDGAAAKALRDISLGFAAAQSTLEARVFWKICAAYFEAVSLGLCPPDIDGKRAVSRILLQYRTLARGESKISGRLVQDLLFFCAPAVPKLIADAPVLAAVRSAYGLTQTDAVAPTEEETLPSELAAAAMVASDVAPASQVVKLADSELADQVKVIGTLRIGIPLYNVFLNEADEWSRRLLTELSEWAWELHRPVSDSTIGLAHSLSVSSATVGFFALSEMARTLEQALRHVRFHAQGAPEYAQVFIEVAEDIRRLLHQFAAGFLKEPHHPLLDALQAILQIDFSAVAQGARNSS